MTVDYSMLAFGHSTVQYLMLLGLCSERLLVLMMIFPPTAEGVLQGRVRNAAAMLWASLVAYGHPHLLDQIDDLSLVAISLKEAVIGIVLGFAASTVFWAADAVGTYVDDLTGYNQVQLQNPSQGQQTSLTSTLLSQFAIAAFWLLGGMTFLLGAVYQSYNWWPLDNLAPVATQVVEAFVLHQTDSLMQTVAKLATPMIMALLLIDIGFSLTGKVSQKLNLTTLGQPVKSVVTVLLLALLSGVFIDQVRDQLALTDLTSVAQALSAQRGAASAPAQPYSAAGHH